jgi:hypothetical protein
MTTDTDSTPAAPDEIALPGFEDALWAALRAEHAEHAGGPASSTATADAVEVHEPTPIVVPVDATGRRHRALRRVLAAAAAVAVLAGIGVVVATGGEDGDGTTVAGPSTESTPEPTLEEQISAAMLAADAEGLIERSVGSGPRMPTYTEVLDPRSRALRQVWYGADGRVLAEQGAGSLTPTDPDTGDLGGGVVDHCARTFTPGWGMSTNTTLQSVGSDMERGIWAVDGTEVVDGRELIRLRTWTDADMPMPDPDTGMWARPTPADWNQRLAVYVDPDSLLPVLTRHGIGEPDEIRVEHTFLPRTEANLAETVVTVPEGYETLPRPEWMSPLNSPPSC